jgi:peroxiredoxin Q/BCP
MALEIGSQAPAFALQDQHGTTVSLADFAGRWVVLYFYPKDDTPGCTTEACEFSAAITAFRGLDAAVLGCSADSVASHAKFGAKYGLDFPLLSDPDKVVMTAYGAWGEKTMYGKKVTGVIRSTVIIAPDGTVAHRWASVKAAGHAAKVQEVLARLQAGRG